MLASIAYAVGAVRRLAIRDPDARRLARGEQRGRLLRWAFTRLGATFVKVGQVASSRPDLFSAPVIAQLQTLQDRVPSFAFARVREIVERGLGTAMTTLFREFDRAPIAAGGIAQVHHAVLFDGTEVAVKVLRPDVRARAYRDARLLLWLAHVAHLVSARARAADVVGHTRGVVGGIVAQTHLRHEARNYRRFRREFEGDRTVAFPRTIDQYCSDDVIVMEFIHGVRLDALRADQMPSVTRALRGAFFAMCFEHGLVHADLHPGNVLVRDDGVVVLLDLGLVKHLSPSVIAKVVDFARCLVIGNAHDLVEHLRHYHACRADTDWVAVAADAKVFVDDLRRRAIAEIEVTAVVARLFELARKHRIRPMSELSLVLLGMVTIEGIAKRLDPSANTMLEIARYLGPRVAQGAQGAQLARGTRDWQRSAVTGAIDIAPAPATPVVRARRSSIPPPVSEESSRPNIAARRTRRWTMH